ncbi:HPF/RaiA family ribosome-associated protein [Alphaproteobacteria bacterium]|nr:HPF/RaiA family ribosome-associated protein [Alphaproteobacteria bacterium]
MNTLLISKKVLGKNLKIGNNFSTLCKKKINNILAKYSAKVLSYTTSLEKKKNIYKVKVQVVFRKKIIFSTVGKDLNANKALDLALNNTSKMVRRYIRRLKVKKKNRLEVLSYKNSLLINLVKD